ncbi:MAG: sigma-54 interaction domain-containing protein [Bacteroidia bacterium]
MTVEEVKKRFRIIGDSQRILQAVELAMRVAPTDANVLILGENGTGKEIFASMIHQLSRRRHKPYIAINCGAIPEGTLDSELFGHQKGSFTSAYETRRGYFEEADGGTIFLDEVAEMPLGTQARLLRVLETGEFYRVGSSKVQKTDVRVLAATNKNLLKLIQEGKFREDLYYRLHTIALYIPPLRDRGLDIEKLFDYFAQEMALRYHVSPVELTPQARRVLYQHHWPGNVREIKHFAEKLTILYAGKPIDAPALQELLPPPQSNVPVLARPQQNIPPSETSLWDFLHQIENHLLAIQSQLENLRPSPHILPEPPSERITLPLNPIHEETPFADHTDENLSLEENKRRLIEKALKKYQGNRKKASQALGISERTLYRILQTYGLHKI